jgi:hypothetical protein
VSRFATRRNPLDLQGATLRGKVYIFVPDVPGGASTVAFYVDDPDAVTKPLTIERNAPYDFAGGTVQRAYPFDSAKFGNGTHVITAVAVRPDGSTALVRATFTVAN